MRVVDPRELKKVAYTGDYGGFSRIFKAEFGKVVYCYKLFTELYDRAIIDNLTEMTDLDLEKFYLSPLYMVGDILKQRYNGYLCNYAENVQDLGFVCDKNKILRYLRSARDLINNLHNNHQIVHGDISESNILVNTDEDLVYLCDFDSALRFGQEVKSTCSFSDRTYNYLQYNKFDKNVDVFNFNLMTLELLTNSRESGVFPMIALETCNFIEENNDVKRLAKELLYYESGKPLSGEYIVDYLGDFYE